MENQKKDQLVYEIDLNAPTIFSMVNEAKVNPEKANAAISLDYIGNAGDGGASVSYTHLTLPTTPYV